MRKIQNPMYAYVPFPKLESAMFPEIKSRKF